MFQAGASTVFSLLVLATIHAYMVQVFVKVVLLVVSLGMASGTEVDVTNHFRLQLHGLVVLPIIYVAIPFNKYTAADGHNKVECRPSTVAPTKIAIASTPELPIKKLPLEAQKSVPRKDQGRG